MKAWPCPAWWDERSLKYRVIHPVRIAVTSEAVSALVEKPFSPQ